MGYLLPTLTLGPSQSPSHPNLKLQSERGRWLLVSLQPGAIKTVNALSWVWT